MPHYQFFVCNHKEIRYDYRQKIDNVAQLQIIDHKKKNYRKKSVISACNVYYRLKRSGPKYLTWGNYVFFILVDKLDAALHTIKTTV